MTLRSLAPINKYYSEIPLGNFILHISPQVLDRVEVRAVARPIQNLDSVLSQKSLCNFRSMARSAILHEDSTVIYSTVMYDALPYEFSAFLPAIQRNEAVHGCSSWQKGDPSHTMFRNRTPNHLTWWMLHRRNRVFLIESRSTWPSNVSFPNYELLQRRFIREHDFAPTVLASSRDVSWQRLTV